MKYLIIDKEKKIKQIINYLIELELLPKIQNRLDIFEENGDFRIEILNNKICFRKNDRLKKVFIKNKNIKYFFKSLDNSKKYYINDITIYNFTSCSLLLNTYHGTIISSNNEELINNLKIKFDLLYYNNINEHKLQKNPKAQYLFDQIGNLNAIIKNYSVKVGLDIRSTSTSLRLRLSNISNDYSYLEYYYKYVTNQDLLTINNKEIGKYNIRNMSIIIPVYNQNVIYSLLSIQGQNLSKAEKNKIQVIVVNDGSKNNIIEEINRIRGNLDFELQIISLENNMGLSNARNVGYAIAKYEYLLFMDSDIILSKNYIYDMNIRMQLIPNAIFVCMRKNIDRDSDILNSNNLLKGIDSCTKFDDSRIITKAKEYHIGCNKAYIGEQFEILDDTNYFKELSFGSQVGIYNIATVVTGHNIALHKSLINFSKPFDNTFKGWGMEDAYFASNLIAQGCYVIPVLSSCVYHINHLPRSGSEKQKNKEALENYNIYNKLLDEAWN
ncbi:MAG: glycosyltransferase family A protein [Clostridia bacterium]|nr:glycosyltransferase family A protein [Clostridia bacterium]